MLKQKDEIYILIRSNAPVRYLHGASVCFGVQRGTRKPRLNAIRAACTSGMSMNEVHGSRETEPDIGANGTELRLENDASGIEHSGTEADSETQALSEMQQPWTRDFEGSEDGIESSSSSPFILQPELDSMAFAPQIRLQDYASLSSPENKNAQLSINDGDEVSEGSQDTNDPHQSYNDANELLVTLDSDFAVPPRPVNGVLLAPMATPWRTLRMAPGGDSTLKALSRDTNVTADLHLAYSSGSARIEELNKQIVGYRIQIKFFKNFLQTLIQRDDYSEVIDAINTFLSSHGLNELNLNNTESQVEEMRAQLLRQTEDYNEVLRLNEDLYASLEHFQSELRQKEEQYANDTLQWCQKLQAATGDSGTLSELVDRAAGLIRLGRDKTIEELEHTIRSFQSQSAHHLEEYARVERLLYEKGDTLQRTKQEYQSLRNQFDEKSQEYDRVVAENSRLHQVSSSVDSKLEEYQKEIDHLKVEVNNVSHNGQNHELAELRRKYATLQQETRNTVASLTNQIQKKVQESIALKAESNTIERLKLELDNAVEKQRILQAEKIRLTYSLETMSKDRAGSGNHEALESNLHDLLSYDITQFEGLLESFVKIADDISLKDPQRKIDWLRTHTRGDRRHDLMSKKIHAYHKSVFDYFVRAVEIIVHDHVKVLLKEGEALRQREEYIQKLQHRIDEYHDTMADTKPLGSPRTSLRIEELTKRWKAEREARVYEGRASQKRLQELELENAKLRNELSRG